MIDENSTLEDVCFEVSTALDRHSITGVLTGGSAATVYAPNVYTSYDADFVLTSYPERQRLEQALAEIGYVPSACPGMYEHLKNGLHVGFSRWPFVRGGRLCSRNHHARKGRSSPANSNCD